MNYDAVLRGIWNGPKPLAEKIKLTENLTKAYYAEKRDKTAREAAKKGPSNLDPNNPEIRKAEEYAKSIQNPNFKKHK